MHFLGSGSLWSSCCLDMTWMFTRHPDETRVCTHWNVLHSASSIDSLYVDEQGLISRRKLRKEIENSDDESGQTYPCDAHGLVVPGVPDAQLLVECCLRAWGGLHVLGHHLALRALEPEDKQRRLECIGVTRSSHKTILYCSKLLPKKNSFRSQGRWR